MSEHKETFALTIAPTRQILRDFRGNLRAIAAVLAILLAYVVVSSLAIAAEESWSFLHAAYFTVINVTTVGFGEVTALTHAGKLLSGVNSLVGLLLFGVLVAVLTLAIQPGEFSGTASLSLSLWAPRPKGREKRTTGTAEEAVGPSVNLPCGPVLLGQELFIDGDSIGVLAGLDRKGLQVEARQPRQQGKQELRMILFGSPAWNNLRDNPFEKATDISR